MTERELKRLSRADLLELLLAQSRQIDALQAELAQTKQLLEDKNITIRKAGSLADAALQLNGVFEAAQKACEQYTLNIENMSKRQEQICAMMEQKTKEKCARMLREAKRAAAQQNQPDNDIPEWIQNLLDNNSGTRD